jgi:ABC-type glucose/galactose transport system permease subunit
LNESEFYALTRDSKLLRIWIFRGVFYAFIGVLGLNEHAAAGSNFDEGYKHRDVAINCIVIVAWVMILIGMLYVLMGVLCLQLVYNRLEEAYLERLARSREVRRATQRYGGVSGEVV